MQTFAYSQARFCCGQEQASRRVLLEEENIAEDFPVKGKRPRIDCAA
jgi:hypothetical protein